MCWAQAAPVWSSRANEHIEVIARNLTFEVSSNQVAVQLQFMNAVNVQTVCR